MKPHTTHHDDCGCLSERYEKRIAEADQKHIEEGLSLSAQLHKQTLGRLFAESRNSMLQDERDVAWNAACMHRTIGAARLKIAEKERDTWRAGEQHTYEIACSEQDRANEAEAALAAERAARCDNCKHLRHRHPACRLHPSFIPTDPSKFRCDDHGWEDKS